MLWGPPDRRVDLNYPPTNGERVWVDRAGEIRCGALHLPPRGSHPAVGELDASTLGGRIDEDPRITSGRAGFLRGAQSTARQRPRRSRLEGSPPNPEPPGGWLASVHQSPAAGNQPLPPAARSQPGELVPVGRRSLRASEASGSSGLPQHRLLHLPLVPRHGGRVLRRAGDRPDPESALRGHQGGSRGASGCRRDLHERSPGDDWKRRLAPERLADAGAEALLRGNLLPSPRSRPPSWVPNGPAGDPAALLGGTRPARAGRGSADGIHQAGSRSLRRDGDTAPRRRSAEAGQVRVRSKRGSSPWRTPRSYEVSRNFSDPVSLALPSPHGRPGSSRAGDVHPRADGGGRHSRPDRWWLSPLLHRSGLAGPALREDALRQRASGPRLSGRLAGHGTRGFRAGDG